MARTLLWLLGGVLCSTGIMCLLFSFGTPWGDIALNLSQTGFDAVGDITTTPTATFAFFCIATGVPILVALNATAWKSTGGY
jgi:hypothetical protein